jgi:hypothetical protein
MDYNLTVSEYRIKHLKREQLGYEKDNLYKIIDSKADTLDLESPLQIINNGENPIFYY